MSRARPRRLVASRVLDGLTSGDVCEAVAGVRVRETLDGCRETVARIVARRCASVREGEGDTPYAATAG